MEPLNYVLFAIVAIVIAVSFVITVRRNRAIRKNGIEVNATISKIEERDTVDSDGGVSTTYTYFVKFTTVDGNTAEAMLGEIFQKSYRVGDELRVMYLPEKPNYAVPVKR